MNSSFVCIASDRRARRYCAPYFKKSTTSSFNVAAEGLPDADGPVEHRWRYDNLEDQGSVGIQNHRELQLYFTFTITWSGMLMRREDEKKGSVTWTKDIGFLARSHCLNNWIDRCHFNERRTK